MLLEDYRFDVGQIDYHINDGEPRIGKFGSYFLYRRCLSETDADDGVRPAASETARFLARRGEEAPGLAERAGLLADHAGLAAEIDACIDAEGAVRDSASAALADARREANRLKDQLEAYNEGGCDD